MLRYCEMTQHGRVLTLPSRVSESGKQCQFIKALFRLPGLEVRNIYSFPCPHALFIFSLYFYYFLTYSWYAVFLSTQDLMANYALLFTKALGT